MARTRLPACPTCGRRALRRQSCDVRTRVGRKILVVRGVEAEVCSACGERLYDLAALRQLRRARALARARNTRAA